MKTAEVADRKLKDSKAGAGLRVLIIDDDAFHAEGLAQALGDVGYHCDTANSGREGADRIETDDFDVILTDLRMPDLDGMAILRKARAKDPPPEVVVITGHSKIESAVAAMQQGAASYL